MALDDKLYQRDLEVALALSVKELPTVTIDAEDCQDKSTDEHGSGNAETTVKSPHISNCSVASDYLDLDKITEEGDSRGARGGERQHPKPRSSRGRSSWTAVTATVTATVTPNQTLQQVTILRMILIFVRVRMMKPSL